MGVPFAHFAAVQKHAWPRLESMIEAGRRSSGIDGCQLITALAGLGHDWTTPLADMTHYGLKATLWCM